MKLHDTMVELLHREIDGLNSREESIRLHAYLESHPEAAREFDELRELSTMLGGLQEYAPRPHVSVRIMNAVRSIAAVRAPSRSLFDGMRMFIARPSTVFAAGVALGCILLVSIVKLNSAANVDAAQLLGTLVNTHAFDSMEAIATIPLDGNGISGSVTAKRSHDVVLVKLTVNATRRTILRVAFEGKELQFKGYVDKKNVSSQAVVEANDLRYVLEGEHEFAMLFDGNGSLKIDATQENVVLFSRTLETAVRTTNR